MSDKNCKKKLKSFVCDPLLVVTWIGVPVVSLATGWFYYDTFSEYKYSLSSQDWGGFGSYIGGILSPLIAGAALVWLIKSVTIQKKELEDTRTVLMEQSDKMSVQSFENLFFNLLNEKNSLKNQIIVKTQNLNYFVNPSSEPEIFSVDYLSQLRGIDAIRETVILFKNNSKYDWDTFYQHVCLDYWGAYFRLCYQIVKLIDKNKTLHLIDKNSDENIPSGKQKEYFDIFRATFSAYEFEAMFFNCLFKYGNGKFKDLLERYGMFEPMYPDTDEKDNYKYPLTKYAYKYDRKIFEKNESWEKYFTNIDNISKFKYQNLCNHINNLTDEKIISFKHAGTNITTSQDYIISMNPNFQSMEKMASYQLRYRLNLKISAILNDSIIISVIYFLMASKITMDDLKDLCEHD